MNRSRSRRPKTPAAVARDKSTPPAPAETKSFVPNPPPKRLWFLIVTGVAVVAWILFLLVLAVSGK